MCQMRFLYAQYSNSIKITYKTSFSALFVIFRPKLINKKVYSTSNFQILNSVNYTRFKTKRITQLTLQSYINLLRLGQIIAAKLQKDELTL